MIVPTKNRFLSDVSSIFSVLVLGVMSGFFWTYSFNVNYALNNLDADAYAQVQSLLNVNVRHGVFFFFFFGGGLFPALAGLISWTQKKVRRSCWLLLACVVYLLGVVLLTKQVNLPLNADTESWILGSVPEHWIATRDAWNQANLWRVMASAAAFLCGLLALVSNQSRT